MEKEPLYVHKDMSQHAKVIKLIEKAKEDNFKDVSYHAGVKDILKRSVHYLIRTVEYYQLMIFPLTCVTDLQISW